MEDSDEILLSSLRVLPTIYPMIDSKFRGSLPCLKIAMRANMSTLDFILGEEKAKSMLKVEEDAQEAKHQEAVKASIAREEEKKRKEDINKQIETMKKR